MLLSCRSRVLLSWTAPRGRGGVAVVLQKAPRPLLLLQPQLRRTPLILTAVRGAMCRGPYYSGRLPRNALDQVDSGQAAQS